MLSSNVLSMPSPTSETRTLAELAAIVTAEGHPVDVDDAELIVGWEGAVVRTGDGWIFRFPRTTAEEYHRELAILERLAGTLPVPTPDVEWTGQQTPFAAYRTIMGASLSRDVLATLSADERDLIGRSLADFLVAMHDRAPSMTDLQIPVRTGAGMGDGLQDALPQYDSETRASLERLLTAYEQSPIANGANEPVLVHGDFHFGNMVFTPPAGPLAGIWDFSCVELADPAHDFRYLLGDHDDLVASLARHYTAATGRHLDLAGARLARLLEDLGDAIEEDRPIAPILLGGGFHLSAG